MNPEGILIEAAMSSGSPISSYSVRQVPSVSDVGVWKSTDMGVRSSNDAQSQTTKADKSKRESRKRSRDELPSTPSSSMDPKSLSPELRAMFKKMRKADEDMVRLRREWLQRRLDESTPPQLAYKKLLGIYLRKVHPMLPIFDASRLQSLGDGWVDHAIRLVVCLSASTDSEASQHLILGSIPIRLPATEYSTKVISVIRLLLQEADFRKNMLDHIRILALTSFFWQPQNENDRDGPVRLFAEAVALVHSIGLHIGVSDAFAHSSTSNNNTTDEQDNPEDHQVQTRRLFLCIYALDRMIASLYGRPVLLHPRDFDRDIAEYTVKQDPCFRLFIYVIISLDNVINLYRPQPPQGLSSSQNKCEVAVFEALVLDAGAVNVSQPILGKLEG
jgi:hypothetical protein